MTLPLILLWASLLSTRERSAPLPAAPPPPAAATAACPGATTVWVAVHRPSIPQSAAPLGSCALPDIIPIGLEALVVGATGDPVPGCNVLFWVDAAVAFSCGRPFGETCPSGLSAITDAQGVAHASYTVTQADLDQCNCLSSGCHCLRPTDPVDCDPSAAGIQTGVGLCPTPARCAFTPSCSPAPPQDLFCDLAFRATAAAIQSANVVHVEYGAF